MNHEHLERAADALATHPGADMKQLAEAMRISRATLYRHVSDRDDLVVRVVLRALQVLDEATSHVGEGAKSHEEAFAQLFEALVPVGVWSRFLLGPAATLEHPDVRSALDRQGAEMRELIEDAVRAGEVRGDFATWWVSDLFTATVVMTWEAVDAGKLARLDAGKLAHETFWSAVCARGAR